jgi:predicted small lipoprotein YifL
MKWRIASSTLIVVCLLGLSGCEREGPMERAGEKVDRGVDKAGDSLENAGDRTRDRTQR